MEVFLMEQQVKSPTGVKRETRIYALSSVAYKTNSHGEQVPDLRNSTVHDWTSTHSWEQFAEMLEGDGHTVKVA